MSLYISPASLYWIEISRLSCPFQSLHPVRLSVGFGIPFMPKSVILSHNSPSIFLATLMPKRRKGGLKGHSYVDM